MDTPLQWGRADIVWSPPGHYTLRVPMWLDARATVLFDGIVREVLKTIPGDDVSYELEQATRSRDASGGTSVEPGELRLTSSALLEGALKPASLRTKLDFGASAAAEEAEKDDARYKARAESFLAVLRGDESQT